MAVTPRIAAVALLAALVGAAAIYAQSPLDRLAIRHVTLIDGTGASPQRDVTVLVIGRRIERVGPSGDIAIPAGVAVIEGSGKFLIPGLWDMHVHLGGYDAGREML